MSLKKKRLRRLATFVSFLLIVSLFKISILASEYLNVQASSSSLTLAPNGSGTITLTVNQSGMSLLQVNVSVSNGWHIVIQGKEISGSGTAVYGMNGLGATTSIPIQVHAKGSGSSTISYSILGATVSGGSHTKNGSVHVSVSVPKPTTQKTNPTTRKTTSTTTTRPTTTRTVPTTKKTTNQTKRKTEVTFGNSVPTVDPLVIGATTNHTTTMAIPNDITKVEDGLTWSTQLNMSKNLKMKILPIPEEHIPIGYKKEVIEIGEETIEALVSKDGDFRYPLVYLEDEHKTKGFYIYNPVTKGIFTYFNPISFSVEKNNYEIFPIQETSPVATAIYQPMSLLGKSISSYQLNINGHLIHLIYAVKKGETFPSYYFLINKNNEFKLLPYSKTTTDVDLIKWVSNLDETKSTISNLSKPTDKVTVEPVDNIKLFLNIVLYTILGLLLIGIIMGVSLIIYNRKRKKF